MKCSHCGIEIPDGSEFCLYCGQKQDKKRYCHKCGRQIPSDSEFCQHCGATQDEINAKTPAAKKSVNKILIIIIAATVVVIVAMVLVFVVIKPFNGGQSTIGGEDVPSTFDIDYYNMNIDERIASAQHIEINSLKADEDSIVGQNICLSGYVIDDHSWNSRSIIRIAEKQIWPYDITDSAEFYDGSHGGNVDTAQGVSAQSIDEWEKQHYEREREYEKIPKTPTEMCVLLDDGICEGMPKEGNFVTIYGIVHEHDYVDAYYIKVQ